MDRRAQVFGLKECQFAFTERRTYDRYILYEKSTVQLASVGLAQARPNYYAMVGWLVGYFRDQDKKGVSVGKNVH